jgi:hypothetical protein
MKGMAPADAHSPYSYSSFDERGDSCMNSSDTATAGILSGFVLFAIICGLAITVFYVWVFWRVFVKTGMNGALGLICLIPIGPLICMLILAFTRWPIEDALAAHGGGMPQSPYPPSPPPPPLGSQPPGSTITPT